MAVSEKERSDYEQGRKDGEKGVFEQAFNDITVNHPDSDAYYRAEPEENSTTARRVTRNRARSIGRNLAANGRLLVDCWKASSRRESLALSTPLP